MAQAVVTVPLNIAIKLNEGRPSIVVKGNADSTNICDVVSMLDRLADEDGRCVSLDLRGVESIDNSAIESLAGSASILREQQRRMHLAQVSSPVQSLLNRLQLSDLFCCEQECAYGCSPETCRIATKAWDLDVFTLPCSMDHCHEARSRVRRVAEAVGFSKCKCDDVMLAIGEAVTNAIRYGKPAGCDGLFTVSCIGTADRLCVSINDNGPGFDPDELPSLEEALFLEHGRGVHFMNAVMDKVTFDFAAGTTVRMVKLGP